MLKELPPKIIQDVICELTPFQEYTHQLIEKVFPIQQSIQQMEQQPSKKGGKEDKEGPKMGKQIL